MTRSPAGGGLVANKCVFCQPDSLSVEHRSRAAGYLFAASNSNIVTDPKDPSSFPINAPLPVQINASQSKSNQKFILTITN
jgi:hypothetical protein